MTGIIVREELISLASVDFTAESGSAGFYFRCTGAGNINYVPIGNADSESIIGAFDASAIFNNPVLCRKILKTSTTATGIYIGKEQ
jgi:hypothetical protein